MSDFYGWPGFWLGLALFLGLLMLLLWVSLRWSLRRVDRLMEEQKQYEERRRDADTGTDS